VPLLHQPISPLRCSFCSFFNTLVFATSKTSDSSLFPYQEPRPTKEDALWPFPNLVTIPISDRPQLEGERVICKNFIGSRVAMGNNMKPGHFQEGWRIIPDLSAYIWYIMLLSSEHFVWDFCNSWYL
jgi:hypothetical protein